MPDATTAQDIEPEYITVSDDGRKEWVTLQENNDAIAKIDIRSASTSCIRSDTRTSWSTTFTDPRRSSLQYFNNRDFATNPVGPDSGPEIVHFISAVESPNGKPMVLVSNEISGTVSLWGQGNSRP